MKRDPIYLSAAACVKGPNLAAAAYVREPQFSNYEKWTLKGKFFVAVVWIRVDNQDGGKYYVMYRVVRSRNVPT